ncbi:MAG: hypothetical protein KGL39_59840 [Patescibacteria group bacterium]|nr:hypothetical protein [Patescibacteria group bacterium]
MRKPFKRMPDVPLAQVSRRIAADLLAWHEEAVVMRMVAECLLEQSTVTSTKRAEHMKALTARCRLAVKGDITEARKKLLGVLK